jgi:phage terminase small subunit
MGSSSGATPARAKSAPKPRSSRRRKAEPAATPTSAALREKHRLFLTHYLVDLNATQAALRAGYKPSYAESAHKLLRRPDIAAALEEALAERRKQTLITADRVLEEYARIAFADLRRVASWGPGGVKLREDANLSEADVAAIAEVTQSSGTRTRVKLHDKRAALDSIARHLGLFTPRPPAYDPKALSKPEEEEGPKEG